MPASYWTSVYQCDSVPRRGMGHMARAWRCGTRAVHQTCASLPVLNSAGSRGAHAWACDGRGPSAGWLGGSLAGFTTPGAPHLVGAPFVAPLPPSLSSARWACSAHGAAAQPKHLAEPTPSEETLSWAAPLFPELAEAQTRCVLVGIDPDLSGALAVLTWRNGLASGAGAQDLAKMTVRLHDVPIEMVKLTTRERRQHCGERLLQMLQVAGREDDAEDEARASEALVLERPFNLPNSPSRMVRRGVLEMTAPAHMSGKHAWFTIGYAAGLLDGLFRACGLPYKRVHAATWKRDLGLFGAGKEGSMLLAKELFPQAEPMLARKRDHGRAEALLIAAWALGARRATPSSVPE